MESRFERLIVESEELTWFSEEGDLNWCSKMKTWCPTIQNHMEVSKIPIRHISTVFMSASLRNEKHFELCNAPTCSSLIFGNERKNNCLDLQQTYLLRRWGIRKKFRPIPATKIWKHWHVAFLQSFTTEYGRHSSGCPRTVPWCPCNSPKSTRFSQDFFQSTLLYKPDVHAV